MNYKIRQGALAPCHHPNTNPKIFSIMEQTNNQMAVLSRTAGMMQIMSSIQYSLSQLQQFIIARDWEPTDNDFYLLDAYEDNLAEMRSSLNIMESTAEAISRKQSRS